MTAVNFIPVSFETGRTALSVVFPGTKERVKKSSLIDLATTIRMAGARELLRPKRLGPIRTLWAYL